MTADKPKPPLEDLDSRLRAAQARRRPGEGRKGPPGALPQTGLGLGLRIGLEMVVAVGVGTGIGWLLDRWWGTAPWMMIVFFILGSGAGFMNVFRTISGIGHGVGYRPSGGAKKAERSGEDAGTDQENEE